jgi:hypothetical protein
MTLQDVQTELENLLPRYGGGVWNDASYTHPVTGDVILHITRQNPLTDEERYVSPGFESNMSQHSRTVRQLLGLFAGRMPSIRVIEEYWEAP